MSILLLGLINTACAQHWLVRKPARLLSKEDTVKAVEVINKRISRHPKLSELYRQRANVKLAKGDFSEALIDYNSYCSLNQDQCNEVAMMKANILYRQRQYNQALEVYSSALDLKENPDVLIQIGLCNEKLGRIIDALSSYSQALSVDPRSVSAAYNAGRMAARLNKYELSAEHFSKAVNLLPADYHSWLGLGIAKNQLGRYEESNKALRQAAAIKEEDPRALYNIGVNYYHLNELDLCCEYWERAIKSGSLAAEIEVERYCAKE